MARVLLPLVVAFVAAAPAKQAPFDPLALNSAQPQPVKDTPASPVQHQHETSSAFRVAVRKVNRAASSAGTVQKTVIALPDAMFTCFSTYIYTVLMDAVAATENEVLVAVDSGGQAMTIITLCIILVMSLMLLFVGAQLVKTAVLSITWIISFMTLLYFFNWVCGSADGGDWVACLLPFILAFVLAIVCAAIVFYFLEKMESLVFFILGAAGGAITMYLLRNIILSAAPQLITSSGFNFFWLALVGVAILCGFIASCLHQEIIISVTALAGAYGLACSIVALVPASSGELGNFAPLWVFWLIFFIALPIGLGVQCKMSAGKGKDKK